MSDIQNHSANGKRDEVLARLLDHCERLPDPQEVFFLLETVNRLGGITSEEASALMHLYWKGEL